MKKSFATAITKIHEMYLNARNLDRIVNQVDLKKLFDNATEWRKSILITALEAKDKPKLVKWIREEVRKDFEDKPVRELRIIASGMKIYSYGTMDKAQLLVSIGRIQDGKGDVVTRSD